MHSLREIRRITIGRTWMFIGRAERMNAFPTDAY